jgi:hypothetical protein
MVQGKVLRIRYLLPLDLLPLHWLCKGPSYVLAVTVHSAPRWQCQLDCSRTAVCCAIEVIVYRLLVVGHRLDEGTHSGEV